VTQEVARRRRREKRGSEREATVLRRSNALLLRDYRKTRAALQDMTARRDFFKTRLHALGASLTFSTQLKKSLLELNK
jgi:hypothetical protein